MKELRVSIHSEDVDPRPGLVFDPDTLEFTWVDANGERNSISNGGSVPIGCILDCNTPVDCAATNGYTFAWDALLDNLWDQNSLDALPAGIGFTVAFDGSDPSGTITTTEDVWLAATLGVSCDLSDPTFQNQLSLIGPITAIPDGGADMYSGFRQVLSLTPFFLPSGVGFGARLQTLVAATSPTFPVNARLVITRLA